MRPLSITLLSLVAAVAIGACSAVAPAASPAASATSLATDAAASASPSQPATEAPATEAPATEAPATRAPASEAPASEAPASEAPASEAPEPTMDHAAMTPVDVTIVDFAFEPATVQVAVGQTVRWTNEGGQPHTVKSDDGTIASPIVLREPFEWTAEGDAGTSIAYICGIHPSMRGTIEITR